MINCPIQIVWGFFFLFPTFPLEDYEGKRNERAKRKEDQFFLSKQEKKNGQEIQNHTWEELCSCKPRALRKSYSVSSCILKPLEIETRIDWHVKQKLATRSIANQKFQ